MRLCHFSEFFIYLNFLFFFHFIIFTLRHMRGHVTFSFLIYIYTFLFFFSLIFLSGFSWGCRPFRPTEKKRKKKNPFSTPLPFCGFYQRLLFLMVSQCIFYFYFLTTSPTQNLQHHSRKYRYFCINDPPDLSRIDLVQESFLIQCRKKIRKLPHKTKKKKVYALKGTSKSQR
jgi:magnesium-transporting ATPase (P-type)